MNESIRQEVIIAAKRGRIFKELFIWGEAEWWPKKSLMQFVRLNSKTEGILYLARVKLPFGPHWHIQNEIVDEAAGRIKRVFLDGIFRGFEELQIVPYEGYFKIIYTFCVRIEGFLNQLIWKSLFRRLHINNINLILVYLKLYLQQ